MLAFLVRQRQRSGSTSSSTAKLLLARFSLSPLLSSSLTQPMHDEPSASGRVKPNLVYYGRESVMDYYRGKVNALEESPAYSPYRVLSMIDTMERMEADYALHLPHLSAAPLPPLLDITIFNSKLKAQLAIGKRTAALETLKLLESRGLSPNQMTFVYLFQEISKSHASLRHGQNLLSLMTRKYGLAPNALIYFHLVKCVKRLGDVPFALQYYAALVQFGPVDPSRLESLIRFASMKRLTPLLRFLLSDIPKHDSHVSRLLIPHYPTMIEHLLRLQDPYATLDLLLIMLQNLGSVLLVQEGLYKDCMAVAEATCSLPLALAILRNIVSCPPSSTQQSLLTALYLSTLRVALAPGAFESDAQFSSPLQLVFVLLYELSQRAMPISLEDLEPLVQYMVSKEGRLEEGEQVLTLRYQEMTRPTLSEHALVAFGKHCSSFFHALLLGYASRQNESSVARLRQSMMSTYRVPMDTFHFHALVRMNSMTGKPSELMAIVQTMAAAKIPPTISTMKRILSGLFDSHHSNESTDEKLVVLDVAKSYLQRFMSQPSPSALFTLSLTSHLDILLKQYKERHVIHDPCATSLEMLERIQDIENVAQNWIKISNSKF